MEQLNQEPSEVDDIARFMAYLEANKDHCRQLVYNRMWSRDQGFEKEQN